MELHTRGLVLREVTYKEADKILTVLTEDAGKLTISAHGARRQKSKCAALSQFLAFSELDLQERRGRWQLHEGRVITLFDGIRKDILLLAVGAYFAELLEAVSDADYADPALLHLGITGLAALDAGKREWPLIKAAFEFRLMCVAGYAPPLEGAQEAKAPALQLDAGSAEALRHIVSAPLHRVFSFTLGAKGFASLSRAAERYVLTQLERSFRTLDFLKDLDRGNMR